MRVQVVLQEDSSQKKKCLKGLCVFSKTALGQMEYLLKWPVFLKALWDWTNEQPLLPDCTSS